MQRLLVHRCDDPIHGDRGQGVFQACDLPSADASTSTFQLDQAKFQFIRFASPASDPKRDGIDDPRAGSTGLPSKDATRQSRCSQ